MSAYSSVAVCEINVFVSLLAMVEVVPPGKKFYVDPSNYECLDEAVSDFTMEISASQVQLQTTIGAGKSGCLYVHGVCDERQLSVCDMGISSLLCRRVWRSVCWEVH